MSEKNQFEPLIGQIVELMSFVQENKGKLDKTGKLPEDFETKLNTVELMLQLYKESFDEVVREKGLKLSKPDQLPARDQKLLNQAKKLKDEVESLKKEINPPEHVRKVIKKKYGKKGGKKGEIQQRKKRFKRIGGNSDWLPL